MKSKSKSTIRLAFPLASAIAALLAGSNTHAASLYWDIDDATAGAGGTAPAGAWTTGGITWSASPNGTVATPAATTAATDDLFFSAGINATGTYIIDLTSAQDAKSLTFQDGNATISGAGGVITLGGTGIINVTNSLLISPNTAVIGANTNTVIGGSAGLTKTGVGTLTLNGTAVNTVTGGLNVNGGTLVLDFANLTTSTDLVNSGNALNLGGGNLSITASAAGTTSQTFGSVTVNSGGGGLLVNPNNGSDTNITLGSLTSTASGGSFVVGRATNSGAGTLSITTITAKDATGIYGGRVVFADGTANTGYDWATTADANPGPYSLSAYTGYSELDITTTGDVTDTNNSVITAGATLPAASNRTTNSLKFENPAATQTFAIGTGNTLTLTSGGLLMTGSANDMDITGGSITAGDGSGPADLVVHQFNPAQPLTVGLTGIIDNTPEISSNIVNNNGQAVTLVKNGPGSVRFLGTANTFTGGVIVNQGSVDFGNLSLNNNPITFNANSFFYTNGAQVTTGGITLNNGSQVTICNNNSGLTVNANVVGSGGLSAANGGQGAMTLTLNGTANTFTGPVRFAHSNGTQQCTINVASLPDTDTLGTGNITFGAGTISSTSQNFSLASTAVAPLTLNNRRFEMAGNNVNQQINNASNQPLTINNDLLVTGSQAKNLQLGGTGTGLSTFAGVIANHPSPTAPGTVPNAVRKSATSTTNTTLTLASVEGIAVGATITGSILTAGTTIIAINPLTREVTLSLPYTSGNNSNFNVGVVFTVPGVVNSNSVTKAGTGTWVVSGDNSYTGPTHVTAGVLRIQHANALGATTTGTLVASNATLQLQGGISYAAEALTLTNSTSNTPLLTNVSGSNIWNGTITTTGNPASSFSRIQSDADTLTLAGTIDSSTNNNGSVVLQGAGAIHVTGQITGTAGLFSGSVNAGAGSIRTLTNASNNYTGATTVSGGTLVGIGANAFGSTTGISIAGIGTLSLRGDTSTSFAKASDSSLYTVSTSASEATIQVDQATVAGTSAKTMNLGALGTTSTANDYRVNFAGANHTSLTMGAMTGPANASATTPGTVTINNTIASTGILTLASYTSANAGAGAGAGETVRFTGTGSTTVTGAITPSSTPLALTKNDAGTLTLSGSNTYTGPTAINGGTLIITGATQGTSTITFGGGILGLNIASTVAAASATVDFTGKQVLVTGTPTLPSYTLLTASSIPGTAPTLAAPAPSGYELQVVSNELRLVKTGTTYATWIDGFFTGVTDPAIIGADADPDFDSIDNATEMVLGGNPATVMDTALLPTIELVTNPSDPTPIPAGNYLLFTYRRSDLSVSAGVTADCETDIDLVAPWTAATGAPGVEIRVDNNFTLTPPAAADTDRVRVYVPRGANTQLFGRLKVVVP